MNVPDGETEYPTSNVAYDNVNYSIRFLVRVPGHPTMQICCPAPYDCSHCDQNPGIDVSSTGPLNVKTFRVIQPSEELFRKPDEHGYVTLYSQLNCFRLREQFRLCAAALQERPSPL